MKSPLSLISMLMIAAALATPSSAALAQGLPTSIGGLELTASTNSPAPGQQVKVTAKSYQVDIDSTNLVWTAGGKTVGRGIGVTSVTVTAPDLGRKLTVTVSATTANGTAFTSSIVISSGSIDFILEPDGYVPPFFRGKLPPAYQNAVKIIAVPHLGNSSGTEYDPSSLLYKWEKGSTVLQSQSGYGKQSLTLEGAVIPRPFDVTLTVTSRDGSAQARAIARVEPVGPSLAFYRNDPLYGPLFNNAIGSTLYLGAQRETSVLAVPYGFNVPKTGVGSLSLSWLINGREHPELASNRSVTLRAPDGTAGTSNVRLRITGKESILQQSEGSFSVSFSDGTSAQTSTVF